MIKQCSLLVLQTAVQQALRLDPNIRSQLSNLQSKVLEIILLPMDIHLFIQVDNGTLVFFASPPACPDTIITSSPVGLISLGILPASQARSLLNDRVKISGDLAVGLELKKIFDSLEIDWLGHLSRFTGDVIAHQVGLIFQKCSEKTKNLSASLSNNIREYVQEEARLFPSGEEVQDFFNEIDELSLYAERLSAHITPLWNAYEAR